MCVGLSFGMSTPRIRGMCSSPRLALALLVPRVGADDEQTCPWRRTSLQFSQIRLTLARTFMAASGRSRQKSEKLLYGSPHGRQDILAGHARPARGSGRPEPLAVSKNRPPTTASVEASARRVRARATGDGPVRNAVAIISTLSREFRRRRPPAYFRGSRCGRDNRLARIEGPGPSGSPGRCAAALPDPAPRVVEQSDGCGRGARSLRESFARSTVLCHATALGRQGTTGGASRSTGSSGEGHPPMKSRRG